MPSSSESESTPSKAPGGRGEGGEEGRDDVRREGLNVCCWFGFRQSPKRLSALEELEQERVKGERASHTQQREWSVSEIFSRPDAGREEKLIQYSPISDGCNTATFLKDLRNYC